MEALSEEAKCSSLLNQLRTIVENSLGCYPGKSWNSHGGMQRLHAAMAEILGHGFRFLLENGKPDLWVFIQGLSWLQPTLAASPSFFNHSTVPLCSPVRNADKAMIWLRNSIDSRNLSEKMSWLLSDYEYVTSCYSAKAFLRQRPYSEAMLMCLRALDQRQILLLAKIDSTLYLNRKMRTKKHHRCSSYPESEIINAKTWSVKNAIAPTISENDSRKLEPMKTMMGDAIMEERINRFHDRVINSLFKNTTNEKKAKEYIKRHLLKRWFSSEDVQLLRRASPVRKRLMENKSNFMETNLLNCSNQTEDKKCSSILNSLTIRDDGQKREHIQKIELLDTQSSSNTSTLFETNIETSVTDSNQRNRDEDTKKERRRSIFFKLPFRIWEGGESDESSESSGDSQTLIQANSKKSFIENGGKSTLPMSISAFPKPSPGQSIMSFLTSGVFSHMNGAELDRENAHFNISDAMIAALEQIKFNQRMAKLQHETKESSDEEVNNLKTQLRIRRRQKQNERCFKIDSSRSSSVRNSRSIPHFCAKFNDPNNTVQAEHQSVNSLSSSMYSPSESISTDQDESVVISDEKNSLSTGNAGLSDSISSDNIYDSGCRNDSSVSAEKVAISLLRKYKENQLPAASEIEWLIPERNAPQQILTQPSNIQINDQSECGGEMTRLRGTTEWAPPRPQIIFTPHPQPSRKVLLEKQNYKCAGCGTTVAQKYASKLRYCDYLGKYFCAGCHSEQTAVIPGRVLSRWDFSKHPVSNFSYQLLDQMGTDPLFNVMDLNNSLYSHVRLLQKIRLLRVALFYLKDFIFSCKYSDKIQEMIKSEPQHIYREPDCYSMADFTRAKNGQLLKALTVIEKNCEDHVNQCQLCQARGFMCEICNKQEIIYPWELNRVVRCTQCGSCYHIKCYQHKMFCPKCARINRRNDLSEMNSVMQSIS